MSVYPLLLPGWEETSTWGHDIDHLYAQVTRNGVSDDDGPEFWITPPSYPPYQLEPELAAAISQVTGVELELVLRAMTAGTNLVAGRPFTMPAYPAQAVPPPARPSQPRVYLDVPYSEKDQAKAAGASWDPEAKRWHDPRPDPAGRPRPALAQWVARPDIPDLLPGENREFGSGLFVDMVPSSCWFTNVRTCVSPQDWERLRRMITQRAGHVCEICGAGEDREQQRWLEAHERWAYDDATGVQTLRRLICLCSSCHLSTHMGYANVTGHDGRALAHLRHVSGMTQSEAREHVDTAGELWEQRSRRTWALDLSMLTDADVTLVRPDDPTERRAAATQLIAQQIEQDDRAATQRGTAPTARRESIRAGGPATDRPRQRWLRRLYGRK